MFLESLGHQNQLDAITAEGRSDLQADDRDGRLVALNSWNSKKLASAFFKRSGESDDLQSQGGGTTAPLPSSGRARVVGFR